MTKKNIHMIAKKSQRRMRILIMEVKKTILFNQIVKTITQSAVIKLSKSLPCPVWHSVKSKLE